VTGHRFGIIGDNDLILFDKVKQLVACLICRLAAKEFMLRIEVSGDYPMLEAVGDLQQRDLVKVYVIVGGR
jgi:hypothetical protein